MCVLIENLHISIFFFEVKSKHDILNYPVLRYKVFFITKLTLVQSE